MKKTNKKLFILGLSSAMVLGMCSTAMATTLYVGSTGFNLDTALNDSNYDAAFRNYLPLHVGEGLAIDLDGNGSAVSVDDFLAAPVGQSLTDFEAANEAPNAAPIWNGTGTPGDSQELSVSGVSAINGTTVAVTFSSAPATAPVVGDFSVSQAIDGAAATAVAPTAISTTGSVVTLTVAPVVATTADQSVVYSVSYKGGAAVVAPAFTVAKTVDPQVAIVATAETSVATYEAAPVVTAEDVTAAEALEVTANADVALVTDTTKNADFASRIAAQKVIVDAAKAEFSDVDIATAAVTTLDTAAKADLTVEANLTTAEAAVTAANTAIANVDAGAAKDALQVTVTADATTVTAARTAFDAAGTVKIVADAEAAVAAYEVAPVATTEDVIAAEALEVTANTDVTLVTDATTKDAFTVRIAAQKVKVEAAKVATAFVSSFEKVTSDVVAGTGATINISAKDQYGDAIDLAQAGTVKVTGTLNGMPLSSSEISYAGKVVTVTPALKETDVLAFTLTNTVATKVVGTSTLNYTVIKGEAASLNTFTVSADKTAVASGKDVQLTIAAKDQYNNPFDIIGSVRWVVNGEVVAGSNGTLTINETTPGAYVVEAFYTVDTKINSSVTINVGAADLTALNLTAGASTGFNQDEIVAQTILANPGAVFTPDMLKFNVVAKTEGTTVNDVTVTAELRGGDVDATKNDIIIVAKSAKAGNYEITPYVGTSFADVNKVAASAFQVTTSVDQAVASIDDITFNATELKVGNDIKKVVTFRNKHNEEVIPGIGDGVVTIQSLPIGLTATKAINADGKFEITFISSAAKSYQVTVANGDVFKTYTLNFATATLTSVSAGADISGVVAGDTLENAKYQAVTFNDQDGNAMSVAKSGVKVSVTNPDGTAVADADVSKLITLGKTYQVAADGTVTYVDAADGDNVVAYKINPDAALVSGAYTVKIAKVDNAAISDTFTVTVGAMREANTIVLTPVATSVALNGAVKVKITPKDQYGDFIALGTDKITVNADANFTAGAVTEINKDGGTLIDDTHPVAAYEVTLTGNTKGTNDVSFTIVDADAFGTGDLIAKQSMTVGSVGALVNSVSVDATSIKSLYSTEGAGTAPIDLVSLTATAKDVNGSTVIVDPSTLMWSISASSLKDSLDATVTATDAFTLAGNKLTAKKDVKGTVTIQVQTANLKTDTVTINLDLGAQVLTAGSLGVTEATALDSDATTAGIQVKLDGVGTVDGEANGAITFTLTGVDQYGQPITTTTIDESEAVVTTGDSSVLAVNAVDGAISVTALSIGDANVYVQYSGQTVVLNFNVNQAAVDATPAAKAAADLQTAKDAEALLTAADYVDYTAVTAALAMAQGTSAEKIAKTTAINDAITALVHI